MSKEIISGVYQIRNKINNKVYVGSSKDISQRWLQHISGLKNNKHRNQHLQYAWNKYGEENFEFSILEIVVNQNNFKDILIEREQFWIDKFHSVNNKFGYNICPNAYTCLGKKTSDVGRENISKGLIKRWKLSDEGQKFHISNLSQKIISEKGVNTYITQNKLSQDDVIDIIKLINQNFTDKDISDIYGIHPNSINSIRNGISWSSVTNILHYKKSENLSENDIANIVSLIKLGWSNNKISNTLNVNTSKINNIRIGNTWTNITNIELNCIPKKKKIVQFSIEGKLIKIWDSISSAQKELNVKKGSIHDCCNKRQNTAFGYKWLFYDEFILHGIDNLPKTEINQKPRKQIVQLTLENGFIKYWDNAKEINKVDNNLKYSSLINACNGHKKSHKYKNYLWYYKEDYDNLKK